MSYVKTIYILIPVLLFGLLSSPAFAQEFSTYQNTKYGFKAQYPLGWVYHEYVYSGEIGNAVGSAFKETTHYLPVVTFCPQVSGKECNLNRDSVVTLAFIDKLKSPIDQ